MFKTRLTAITIFLGLSLVAACAPTAQPTPAPTKPAAQPTSVPTGQTVTTPSPTAAPAAKPGSFTPDPVDLAAAKREGTVAWYTSTPIATAQKIANIFEQETGIKVELFRSGGEAVLSRFLQEVNAGRVVVDVLTVSDPAAFNVLMARGLLVPFRPKNFDRVPDAVKDPQGHYIAQRLNLAIMAGRTDAGVELPKNWTDVTDPKYKGKLVMPDPSFTAIQLMVVATLSQKYGWSYYEKLRDNDIMIVQGHQQVSDTLKRGERAIAAEGGDSYFWVDRRQGHKVQSIFPTDGSFAIAAPTAVIKGSPHPNAAKALAEFMIGDKVQGLFHEEGIYGARSDAKPPEGNPPLSELKLVPVDFAYVEREANNIKSRFNEIFH